MQNYYSGQQQPCQATRIRVQSDIAGAAFRTKQVAEVITWLRLRALNPQGNGFIHYQTAHQGLVEVFGIDPRTATSSLDKDDGKFWFFANGVIKLRSLFKVCQILGIARLTDIHYRELPANEFRGYGKARAELYAAIYKPVGVRANPISRQTIGEITGLAKMQQRRYEKAAKVRKTNNHAFIDGPDGIVPQRQEIITETKILFVNKRLGNSYHSKHYTPGNKGLLRRTNKELKAKSLITEEAPALIKRFFSGFRKIVRALKVRKWGGQGYYLLRNKRRRIEGRLEWVLVSI